MKAVLPFMTWHSVMSTVVTSPPSSSGGNLLVQGVPRCTVRKADEMRDLAEAIFWKENVAIEL